MKGMENSVRKVLLYANCFTKMSIVGAYIALW